MKNKLLVVNTGYSKKKFIFKRLKELGYEVTCLNSSKNWADKYVDNWIVADTFNHEEAIRRVVDYYKGKEKPDGIVTFWEDDVLLTSKLVDTLGLRGIPFDVAVKARNKFKFREFCSQNDLPYPKHVAVKNREDLNKVREQLNFPIVFKPAFGSLTAMIIKVDSPEDLEREYDYIEKNLTIDVETSLNDGLDIFAEEYIDGDEVDIDMIVQNGKVKLAIVSDNFEKSRGKFFLDAGQTTPSNLPEEQQEELIDLAELVLEKLGIFNGCIHFEAKYSSNGPYPLETNLRMGGDYVYSYIKTAWNVDLIELAAKVSTGEYIKPMRNLKNRKYVIGKDLTAEFSGIISELDIAKELFENDYVEDYMMYKELGDSVLVPPEGFETIGWITVSGISYPDANDNLNELLEEIEISVSKFDYESFTGKSKTRENSLTKILESRNYLKAREKVQYLSNSKMKGLKVGIVHDIDKLDVQKYKLLQDDILKLQKMGFVIQSLSLDPNKLIADINRKKVDLVLPILTTPNKIATDVLKLLEVSGNPFVGSNSYVSHLVNNKILLRKILYFHEFPLPEWDYIYELQDDAEESEVEYPFVVRNGLSVFDDFSIAVSNYHEFNEVKSSLIPQGKTPLLLEEKLDITKRISVLLVGNSIDQPSVYKFTVTDEKNGNPARLSAKLKDLIVEFAYDIFSVIGAEDYLNISFMLTEENTPLIFDVSLNVFDVHDYDTDLSELYSRIIRSAIFRYQTSSQYKFAL